MRRVPLVSALLAAALACACDNDDFARITVSDQRGPGAARVDFVGGISVPEGSVVTAHLDFYAHDDDVITDADLQSDDPSVLQIARVSDDDHGYAFLGVKAGTTSLHVIADGKQARSIPAVVTPPP